MGVSIPQAVWPSCNLRFQVWLAEKGLFIMFQYRKRYGPVATGNGKLVYHEEEISFNTASGMAQLQHSLCT